MGSNRFASLRQFLLVLVLLAGVLGTIFRTVFQDGMVQFSNDAPVGVLNTDAFELPAAFRGSWVANWWLGIYGGEISSSLNNWLVSVLGAVWLSKLLVPFSMLFLGASAWAMAKQMKGAAGAAVVTALAMALNSNLFSNACWGLGTRAMTVGFFLLAVAALSDWSGKRGWMRVVLGGFATGMGVMEGADNGVILSLYVAAFVVFRTLVEGGLKPANLLAGFARMTVVVVCAVVIAMHSMIALFNAAVKPELAETGPKKSEAQKWEFATDWSLPPNETLRVIVPGLYGYRLDTPEAGHYRGEVGRTAGWENHFRGQPRHSGAGEYAGLFVVLMAGFAVVQSFRKERPVFSRSEALLVRFWAGAALVSVLLAWGRFAPFYQFIYHLPFFSTIRVPLKFMHPFHACAGILCAYGLTALGRGYLGAAKTTAAGFGEAFRAWWKQATGQDRWIVRGVIGLAGAFVLGWLLFSQAAPASVQRDLSLDIASQMVEAGYDVARAKAEAPAYLAGNSQLKARVDATARFAIGEVAVSALIFVAAGGLLLAGLSGWPGQGKAGWFWVAAGVLVVGDLGRANGPWLKFYDYQEKYRTNGLLETLSQEPWQQRVHFPIVPALLAQGGQGLQPVANAYFGEWVQRQFPFYHIQTLDIPQDPREAADKKAFNAALPESRAVRKWELTNVRFLLGLSDPAYLETMNKSLDPGQARFRLHTAFDLDRTRVSDSYPAVTNAAGPFALIEFTGALPRASLYTRWQVIPNDAEALAKLADPGFDPAKEVVLSTAPSAAPTPDAAPGKVAIESYSSRLVRMKAEATAPSVLLFIEHIEPAWKAYIDGQPVPTLRANYLVRGVEVPAGSHTVEFRLESDNKGIYLTLGSQVLAVLLIGVVVFTGRKEENASAAP